ncbi:MAG: hypothetical protein AAFV72_21645 [Cyanobacteria bacterium J06635_1]
MMAYNQDGSQQQSLASGELIVVQGNDVSQPLLFDLRTFYETSGLVKGLSLDSPEVSTGSAEVDAVRQEIREALEQQTPLPESEAVDNPTFLIPSAATSVPQADASAQEDTFADSNAAFVNSPANTYLESTLATEPATGATSPVVEVSSPSQPTVNETSQTRGFENSVSSDLNNTEDSPTASSADPSDNNNDSGNNDSEGRPPRRPTSTPPGQGGTPPGQGGTPPGQGGMPPGQGGQGGTPPGQVGMPPGEGGNIPDEFDDIPEEFGDG